MHASGRECVSARRWLPAALVVALVLSSISSAHSTTVEHNIHIVHNVDNRSPEIDPFWYVGRGVRPIGRFGKRHGDIVTVDGGGMQPIISTLEILLNSLRGKENLGETLNGQDRDWLP